MSHQHVSDDPRVAGALRSSVLLGAIVGLMTAVWRSASYARSARAVAALKDRWDFADGAEQRMAIGAVLIVAAITHLALAMTAERPAGWLWLVPAAMAASLGVVLAMSARSPRAGN